MDAEERRDLEEAMGWLESYANALRDLGERGNVQEDDDADYVFALVARLRARYGDGS